MDAENLIEDGIIDEGMRIDILPERQAHLLYLLGTHGQGRLIVAHCSIDGCLRNLPHAEEPDDMVNAEKVEVLLHPLEPAAEPCCDSELRHRFPGNFGIFGSFRILQAVSGESPILAIGMIYVWRRTCLHVQMEEFRMLPRLHTIAIDADGQVALERYALAAGIVGSRLQLFVQMILNIIDFLHFRAWFHLFPIGHA